MPRLTSLLVVLLLAFALPACGGDDEGDDTGGGGATSTAPFAGDTATTPPPETGTTQVETTQSGCEKASKPEPKPEGQLPKPDVKLDRAKTYVAQVDTSCGQFQITLDAKNSPKTSASFVYLARKKFYDGVVFHRIVPGFVIQGGDPQGSGQGGPGYSVVEKPPESAKYSKGVVAMAKTQIEDPGTSGSQFFVVTGQDAGLPPDYAVLGKVTSGQDVVDKIGTVPVDPNTEPPLEPVVIKKVTITEK